MKRGILTLSSEEQNYLLKIITTTPLASSLIATRLANTSNATKIEVSREEVESLLDLFPLPSSQEPEPLHILRTKLSAFLQNL